MDDAREELRDQLAAGKVTAIVGAGVSIQASGGAACASWKGLLGHGARAAAAIDPDFRSRRLQLVEAEIDSGHPDDLGEFLKAAPSDGLEGLRFIAAGPVAVAESAREALEAQPGGTAFELVETAEAALNRRVQSLPALFESPATAIAAELSKFADIALGYSYEGRFFENSEEAAALFYADRPRMLELLIFWARRASRDLQISRQLEYLEVKCWLLFTVLELYADRLPAAFANLAAEHRFEGCLAEVARTGRLSSREAMVMLALLRRGSTRTIDALQASLLRGDWVERHALDAFERLRQVDPELVEALIARLSHDSALVAASSAQALAILAHGHQVDAGLRRRIVDALTRAIRDPRSVRGIYSGDREGRAARSVRGAAG